MSTPLFELTSWSIESGGRLLVHPLNFRVNKGEILGIAGESGSGKTLTLLSLAGLLPKTLNSTGTLTVHGRTGIQQLSGKEGTNHWRSFRRRSIGFIFQEPMSALNPTMRCGKQLLECMDEPDRKKKLEAAHNLLLETGLKDPQRIMRAYPFEISGGQRQRLMIAMALANNPEIILADEPTTALDAELKHQVTALMTSLCRSKGVALLLVSHDLELLGRYCDQLMVMQQGAVVEYGPAATLTQTPAHAYTQMLLHCRPSLQRRGETLPAPGETPHRFDLNIAQDAGILLDVRVDEKRFTAQRQLALSDVAFRLRQGERICILGQSGSGKSTLARIICGLDDAFKGQINIKNGAAPPPGMIQLVFQDPMAALNPNQKVLEILEEALRYSAGRKGRDDVRKRALELLRDVRLPEHTHQAYPHELSGGQCQRVSIARALCADPEVMILDESVSALDPSVQASVLNLLAQLQQQRKLGYLFITHDLDVAAWFSHQILVLRDGKTDAFGETVSMMTQTPTEYTRHLFSFR